jgi:hypothetical protein
LPLHTACRTDEQRDAVVLFLLKVYGGGASKQDADGDYPFHKACCNLHLNPRTMHHLLKAYPEVLHCTNKQSRLPLHALFSYPKERAPVVILRTMLNMDRLIAHKYGHHQLAIHDLIYLLEEGHISLNASAMEGYEK